MLHFIFPKKYAIIVLTAFSLAFYSNPVNAQFNYDIGVPNLFPTYLYCTGNIDTRKVEVTNYGTQPIDSFMLIWNINGTQDSAWFNYHIGVTAPNSIIVEVDTFTILSGINNIMVLSALPNNNQDEDILNDTLNSSVLEILSTVDFLDFCVDHLRGIFVLETSFNDSILWDFGDGSSLFSTNDTVEHIYPWSTNDYSYEVTAYVYNLCGTSVDTSFTITVGNQYSPSCLLSTQTIKQDLGVDIFPNPVDDMLNLSLTNSNIKELSISMFNSNGIRVYSQTNLTTSSSFLQIDVSKFSSGIYFIQIQSGKLFETQKLVIN